MAAFIGTYGPYRVYSTSGTVSTATTDNGTWPSVWPTSQTTVHIEFVDATAAVSGTARAAEEIRRFDDADLAELEAEEPPKPPPWLGIRPPRMPAKAFTRRPCGTRRRRRTETARRQVRPP